MAKKAESIHCPRCISPTMLEQTFGGVQVRICMNCGANFFQASDLAIPAGASRKPGAVLCPVPLCKGTLERVQLGGDPPLEIERCPVCAGILLDFEEIRRIPLLVSSGSKGEGR
jgi:Zn-finger nucleic acid-binding protein